MNHKLKTRSSCFSFLLSIICSLRTTVYRVCEKERKKKGNRIFAAPAFYDRTTVLPVGLGYTANKCQNIWTKPFIK